MEELSVTPSLPRLRLLADLHIYLVPLDGWLSYQKLARNYMMDEAISLGFVRVQSQITLHDLRKEMGDQLDKSALPRVYVFLRSVGRNLALVKPKQEFQLKVRDFIPPFAVEPELYVLQSPSEWQTSTLNKNNVTVSNTNTRGFSGSKRFNPRKPIRKPYSKGKFRYPRFPQRTVFPALQSGNTNQVSAPSGIGGQHSLVLPPVSLAKMEATPSTTLKVDATVLPLSAGAIKESPNIAVKFPRIKEESTSKKTITKNENKIKTSIPSRGTTKIPAMAAMETSENDSPVRLKKPKRVSVVANVLRSKRTPIMYHRVRPNSHMTRFYSRYPSQRVTSLAIDGQIVGQMTRSAIYRLRHAQCYGSAYPGSSLLRSKPRNFKPKKIITKPQLTRDEQRRLLKGKSFVVLEESIDVEFVENSPVRRNVLSNISEEPSKEADNVSISINSSENTPIMSKSAARKIRHAKCFEDEVPSPIMTLKGVKNLRNNKKGEKKSPKPKNDNSTPQNLSQDENGNIPKQNISKTSIIQSDLDRYMMSINELKKLRHANCFKSASSSRGNVKSKSFYSKSTFKPKTLYKGVINEFGVQNNKDNISITDSSSSQSPARVRVNPLKPLSPSSSYTSPIPEQSRLRKRKPKVYIQGQNGIIREVTNRDVAASVSPVGSGNMNALKNPPKTETQKETKEKEETVQKESVKNSPRKVSYSSPRKTPYSSPKNTTASKNAPKPAITNSPKLSPKTSPKPSQKNTPKVSPNKSPKTLPKDTPKVASANTSKPSVKNAPQIFIAEPSPEPPKSTSDTEAPSETENMIQNRLEVPKKTSSDPTRMSAGDDNGNVNVSWFIDNVQVEECNLSDQAEFSKPLSPVYEQDSPQIEAASVVMSKNDVHSRLPSPINCRCEEDANNEDRIRSPHTILLCSVDR